jgi:hypothetical protein
MCLVGCQAVSKLLPCLPAEDRDILDDKGNLDEREEDLVLENILAVSL